MGSENGWPDRNGAPTRFDVAVFGMGSPTRTDAHSTQQREPTRDAASAAGRRDSATQCRDTVPTAVAEEAIPAEGEQAGAIEAIYAKRESQWTKRIHEVLFHWCLVGNLEGMTCTYRYSGMRTALTKKCGKAIKGDSVGKILRFLQDEGVIHRPPLDEMRGRARLGLGYNIAVLVPPPDYTGQMRRAAVSVLAKMAEDEALTVIEEYLAERHLHVGGVNPEPDR